MQTLNALQSHILAALEAVDFERLDANDIMYHVDAEGELDENALHDMAHEYADSCEDVIYYARARDLVLSAAGSTQDDAYDRVMECGAPADLDTLFVQMAYYIVYDECVGDIELALEAIEDARDTYEEDEEDEEGEGDCV